VLCVHGLVYWRGGAFSISAQITSAEGLREAPPAASKQGAPKAGVAPKQAACLNNLSHEIWGQTDYGEGYVYGPTNRRSGMTVVDLDRDGDNDFVFPGTVSGPLVMQNLGSSSAFYPGGSKPLAIDPLPAGVDYDLGLEFADLNGDGLEDLLAITREDTPQLIKRVVWFRNQGTAEGEALPSFRYEGVVYTSQQPGAWDGIWVTSGDIDADGDIDLYVAEAFVCDPPPTHRVFFLENTGTTQRADWAAPLEIAVLSNLMPGDRVKSLDQDHAMLAPPLRQKVNRARKGACGAEYNLGDIHLADWDLDGLLDFMFYDATRGLFWIENLGAADDPRWPAELGSNGEPRYDHNVIDDIGFAEATFNLEPNPDAVRPGAEWLRDVFISVDSRLKTFRFFVADDAYRITDEVPVAYPAGQGSAQFWDYDQDGDLDLFRMGLPVGAAPNLLTFENVGTPYNPAWGRARVIDDVSMSEGGPSNAYRNDLYQFADVFGEGTPEFFVQGQDGRLLRYTPTPSTAGASPPEFTLTTEDYGEVVNPIHVAPSGRGFAFADFDQFSDDLHEGIAVYTHEAGANIAIIDLSTGQTFDLPDLLPAPGGGTLDPAFIENLATTDANGDGTPDLVVTVSNDNDYGECAHLLYLTELTPDAPFLPLFRFDYACELDAPDRTDNAYARMPSFADIDADGDDDLFIGHRYPPTSTLNLREYLRHYRNNSDTGLFYVRFRTIAGQTRALTLELTTGGGANTELVAPTYDVLQNASAGTLLTDARWRAGVNAPAVDILQTTDLQSAYDFPGEVRSFVDVLPAVSANESKAVIVVGDVQGSDLYDAFSTLGRIAYRVLAGEGLAKESIRFFADTPLDGDLDGVSDVTAKPSLAGLEDSIRTWARGTEKLLVYLVDHGRREAFRMNDTEFLNSSDLADWIDALQSASPNTQVTTLLDFCESGTFVDDLAGRDRITMTSAGIGPIEGVALFDANEYISFSLQFWTQIFNGRTYGQAFAEAKTAIEAINPLQRPQIDDDGDGVGNEGNDGLIADGVRPGADFEVRGPSVHIGEVAPSRAITSNSATLWLSDVVTPFPVEGAKAIIVPPNFERPDLGNNDEQPVSNLPSVLFSFNAGRDRWEASYNGFDEGGLYQIQYFVKTGGQFFASPRIGFIDRVGIPDAWEDDDAPARAPWIPINTVQGHNFHDRADEDWLRFTAPAGEATFAFLSPRPNCQPIVELYRARDYADGNTAPLETRQSSEPGQQLVFTRAFATSEIYFLRIRNADPAVFGRDTSYLALVAVGTGSILSTALFLTVQDAQTSDPVPDASITFAANNIGLTGPDGILQVPVPDYGTYTITVSKEGYETLTAPVTVNNNIEDELLALTPEGVEPPPEEGCGCNDTKGVPLPAGDALIGLGVVLLLAARKRS